MGETYELILDEWDAGCFFNDAQLAVAFIQVLQQLPILEFHNREPDERLGAFLENGYQAFLRRVAETRRPNPLVHTVYFMAKKMLGGAAVTRSRTRAAEVRSTPPQERDKPATPPAPPTNPWRPWEVGSHSAPADVGLPTHAPSPQPGPSSRPDKRAREADGEDEPARPTIEIQETTERYLPRFKTTFREERFGVTGLPRIQDVTAELVGLFDTILQRQREAVGAKDHDECLFEIRGDNNAGKPIWFSKRRTDQMNGEIILQKLVNSLNSNENFMLDGRLTTCYIHLPGVEEGGRALARPNEPFQMWVARKTRSNIIFDPKNIDNMCLTRCVAFAQAFHATRRGETMFIKGKQRGGKDFIFRYKNPKCKIQTYMARSLCEGAKIDPRRPCGISEVKKLQNYLKDVRLIVYTDQYGKDVVFKGPRSTPLEPRQTICLLLNGSHFYAILKPLTAFSLRYLCLDCLVVYSNKTDHRCETSCWRCHSPEDHCITPDVELTKCNDCCRYFAGEDCFRFHQSQSINGDDKKTTCEYKKFCNNCDKTYILGGRGKYKVDSHRCGFIKCNKCNVMVQENHKCFMAPWAPKKLSKTKRYMRVYFDIETSQSEPSAKNPNWLEHKANLLISRQVCNHCEGEKGKDYNCTSCGEREHVFDSLHKDKTNDVITDFIDYIQGLCSVDATEIQLYSHNGSGFDNYFILQNLLERGMKPTVILQGAKIISMKYLNLHFKDSLLFVSQKLSSLPKAFGLTELKKGYFPHLANTQEFYEYDGPMPDKNLYFTSSMSRQEKKEFSTWYHQQINSNYRFIFREEIIAYCKSDVDILINAMESFRTLFMEISGFDPLHNCLTLSSACMAMYRMNHMQPYTLGIPPPGGYRGSDNQSFIALQWLDYQQHLLGDKAKIQTAENGREVIVMGKKVDGYHEARRADGSIEKCIYQFYGCYWHSCNVCIKDKKSRSKLYKKYGEDKYEKTKRISELFKRNGYKVIEKWEHCFHYDLQYDEEMKTYFKNNPVTRTPPLKIRDALAGGRTSALYSYKKADLSKGEKIKFFDVVSEYPYVNFKKSYPYSHPEIFLENDPNMPSPDQWNGIIRATVLPPNDLFLPVLPYKCCSKLMFPLCRTCAESQNQAECRHTSPDDRALTGTFCAIELKKALEKNYKLIKVYEVYQYPGEKCYDSNTKQEGLFSSYVRTNLALKIEASGYPAGVTTEAQKDEYIKQQYERDGVVLRKEKIKKNPGQRTLAKLILNSFWGKMGERTMRSSTAFVSTYTEMMEYLQDSTITVTGIIPQGEDCLQIKYEPHSAMDDSLPTTSILHAAFTTAHGRLVLYECLDIVGENALYHDTDSVCFLSRPGMSEPTVQNSLGGWSNQLYDDYGVGSFITEFVSAGCKNYAYKVAVCGDVNNIKTVIKVRGISINSSCDKIVTFDRLKDMVLNNGPKANVPIPSQIVRLSDWSIVSRPTNKTWQVCLNKRRRIDKECTVPYGFTGELLNNDDYDLLEVLDSLAG